MLTGVTVEVLVRNPFHTPDAPIADVPNQAPSMVFPTVGRFEVLPPPPPPSEDESIHVVSVPVAFITKTWLAVPLAFLSNFVPLFTKTSPALLVVECFIVFVSVSMLIAVMVGDVKVLLVSVCV